MATGRMLQKRISNSRKMALLKSDGARLLYTWMLSHLDANGCFYADPIMVNNIVFTRLNIQHKKVQEYLEELAELGCIIIYEANGEKYLCYPDFFDKQKGLRPEREASSDIPQPLPEQCRSNAGAMPPEEKLKGSLKEGEVNRQSSGKISDCPHQAIISLYHEILPALSKVLNWTPARSQMLRTRWKEDPDRQSLEWWRYYFGIVACSDFLQGKIEGSNGRKAFKADLEWLVRPQNMVKVIEGKYANETPLDDRRWKE